MNKYLDDIFYWLGALLITGGAFLIHPAAAFISAGVFCLVFSFLAGKASANNKENP